MLDQLGPKPSQGDKPKNDKEQAVRLAVGAGIAVAGTVLGVVMFPKVLGTYHWAAAFGALILCCAYGAYLSAYEFARLRSYLMHYLAGFGATCIAPYTIVPVMKAIGEAAPEGSFGNIVGLIPLIAALYAIAATHIVGAEPNVVIATKQLED